MRRRTASRLTSGVLAGLLLASCGQGRGVPSGPAVPVEAGPPAALTGALLLNTGPIPCDGGLHESYWINHTRGARRLAELQLWVGASYGIRADIALGTFRISDGAQLIAAGGLDRYAEPSSLSGQFLTETYAPNFVVLRPEDGIVLQHRCTLLQPAAGALVHVALSGLFAEGG